MWIYVVPVKKIMFLHPESNINSALLVLRNCFILYYICCYCIFVQVTNAFYLQNPLLHVHFFIFRKSLHRTLLGSLLPSWYCAIDFLLPFSSSNRAPKRRSRFSELTSSCVCSFSSHVGCFFPGVLRSVNNWQIFSKSSTPVTSFQKLPILLHDFARCVRCFLFWTWTYRTSVSSVSRQFYELNATASADHSSQVLTIEVLHL